MKTLLFTLGLMFICFQANGQTPVSQNKQDAPTVSQPGVVYLQSTATAHSTESPAAPKQIVTSGTEPKSQVVVLTGSAQLMDVNSKPAEKKIVVISDEPVKSETKTMSASPLEEKKD